MTGPYSSVGKGVPQVDMLVVSSRDKLILGGVSGQSPHFVNVAGDDLLEIEVESPLKNRVSRGAQNQLAAFTLHEKKRE